MDILAKLFGGEARVKLMRLFLFNIEAAYTAAEIADRSKIPAKDVKKELSLLVAVGLIKKRVVARDIHRKQGKKIIIKKVHDTGYIIEQKFPYFQALKSLLITVSLHADESLVKRFSGAGKIKFFVASGLFIQEWDTRVDLLIVGDELNMKRLEAIMETIESEVGREIAYSAFETSDFEYRYGIHDRLIRDILDLPHTVLVDKLGISAA
ncbi:MAG: seg [Candidatus Taylorbacteria bacterium]|nr:seg [Candidatus Taylorbacteria bacterium]